MSKIEWTDKTLNPFAGCNKKSTGCDKCYAMRMAHRLAGMGQKKYQGLTSKGPNGVNWTGKISDLDINLLQEVNRNKKPTRYFVNSMGDFFHRSVNWDYIDNCLFVFKSNPQHTFQILTKYPEKALEYFASRTPNSSLKEYPNIWVGISAEDQPNFNERMSYLRWLPVAVRFASFEPLLGPIEFGDGIDWVIAGGESGPGARPMHPDWVRSLRDQCAKASVPFFFKQWGAHILHSQMTEELQAKVPGSTWPIRKCTFDGNNWWFFHQVGKKKSGNLLDGRQHMEFPNPQPATV